VITVQVRGIPAPQGSKKAFVTKSGKVNMVESSAKVKPWRDAVRGETQAVMQADGLAPLDGPVSVSLVFRLPRPASAPRRVLWPVKQPDLDKLIRSTLDGLTAGGAWADDAQAVRIVSEKIFATPDIPPGCQVILETMGSVLARTPFDGFHAVTLTSAPPARHPEGLPF
jgi:crossover junction endodeoxyribonuclease RusA